MEQLDYFFNPKSIAVIGASREPKKIGHVIFRNLLEGDYKGKVYPVNPNTDNIFDQPCFPSVLKIPKPVDMAVICIPARFVPETLEECGRKGVKCAIIISSGFSEIGNSGLQKEAGDIARKHGIRVLGPNVIGLFDPYSGVDTIFNPRFKQQRPKPGCISFLSQSGATLSVIMDWMGMKGYRASKFVSYGNAMDVDEADLIEYLSHDRRTKVICIYFEGVVNGRKFYSVARKMSKRRPIIAMKGGLTESSRAAVSSHTGNLAGEAGVYSGMFRQAGIIQASDLEQVFDFARTLSTQPKPKGDRVQIITDGGGFGIIATDAVARNGFRLAKMGDRSLQGLRASVPEYVVLKNPIDLTGNATSEMYEKAISAAIRDPSVDMILLICLFQIPGLSPEVVDVIIDECSRKAKPVVVVSSGGSYTEVLKKTLEDNMVPCFSCPKRAAESLKALYDYSRNSKK